MYLEELRFKKKVTQWRLALLTGMSQSKISLIEQGFVSPGADEKIRIAKALQFKPDDLEFRTLQVGE